MSKAQPTKVKERPGRPVQRRNKNFLVQLSATGCNRVQRGRKGARGAAGDRRAHSPDATRESALASNSEFTAMDSRINCLAIL